MIPHNESSSQEAEEIVKNNFQGLDELIEDKDLCQFYKDLIVTCITEYHKEKLREAEGKLDPRAVAVIREKEIRIAQLQAEKERIAKALSKFDKAFPDDDYFSEGAIGEALTAVREALASLPEEKG